MITSALHERLRGFAYDATQLLLPDPLPYDEVIRMNGTDPYERQLDRMPEDIAASEAVGHEQERSPLAVHRDPSSMPTPGAASVNSARGLAWVRPTELAMRVGSPASGRGTDLQTTLSARARRAPGVAARTARRTTRTSIARPEPATQEGLGL